MAKNGNEKAVGGGFPIKIVTRSGMIENAMRPVQGALYQQMQLVLRAPIMSYAVADASKTANEYAGEDVVKAAIEVGSLTEKPLLNIEDFQHVKNNINNISQDDINGIAKKILDLHGDVDVTFIFGDMDLQAKSKYWSDLRNRLPTPPESIKKISTGVNIHEDGVKTASEWLEAYEKFNDTQRRGELDVQYVQIFEKNSKRNPVVIFRGNNIEPRVEGILEENLNSGHLQSLDNYINGTWKEAVEHSRKELPAESNEIIRKIIEEVSNNEYNIRHDDIRSSVLKALQILH